MINGKLDPKLKKPTNKHYKFSCTICGFTFGQSRSNNLPRHETSNEHMNKVALLNSNSTQKSAEMMKKYVKKPPKKQDYDVLKADIDIARSISQHCAIKSKFNYLELNYKRIMLNRQRFMISQRLDCFSDQSENPINSLLENLAL